MRAIDPDVARRLGLTAIGLLWIAAIGWILWPRPTVTVVHWANGHIAGDPDLLPQFAERFNAAGRRTSSGRSSASVTRCFGVDQRRYFPSELGSRSRRARALPQRAAPAAPGKHRIYTAKFLVL